MSLKGHHIHDLLAVDTASAIKKWCKMLESDRLHQGESVLSPMPDISKVYRVCRICMCECCNDGHHLCKVALDGCAPPAPLCVCEFYAIILLVSSLIQNDGK